MNPKTIFFRVDSSLKIGSGHIMRCIALANYLKKKNIISHFIKRNLKGNYIQIVKNQGHVVSTIKGLKKTKNKNNFDYSDWLVSDEVEDAKQFLKIVDKYKSRIIVVDHYGISQKWHSEIKKKNLKLIVIDDLANRKYNCDLLFDNTPGRKKQDYIKKTNRTCRFLLGSKNILLRDDFKKFKKIKYFNLKKKNIVKKIIISMGGVDNNNSTELIVRSIKKMKINININIVLGKNYRFTKSLNKVIKNNNKIKVFKNIKNMPELISNSDLGICSPSVTALEFCYLGLPTLTITNSKNQNIIAKNLSKLGALIDLGNFNSLKHENINRILLDILHNHKKRFAISKKAQKICKANGNNKLYKNIVRLLNS